MYSLRERVKDAALDVGLGRKYGHTGDDTQNCVRFTYAILQLVYPGLPWASFHKALHLNIPDGIGSFANVAAVVEVGAGDRVEVPRPGHWHYCQGWRASGGGHCFLWWEPPAPMAGKGWILEATNATPDWYRPLDWLAIAGRYKGLRLAALI